MSRTPSIWCALAVMWTAACATRAMPTVTPVDNDFACDSYNDHPICLAKTWIGCAFVDDRLCALIGFPASGAIGRRWPADQEEADRRLVELRRVAAERPWSLEIGRLGEAVWELDEWKIEGVRPTTTARFRPASVMPAHLADTREVLISRVEVDLIFDYSVFVRRGAGDRWEVLAWHGAASFFQSSRYGLQPVPPESLWRDVCPSSDAYCARFVHRIRPWSLTVE